MSSRSQSNVLAQPEPRPRFSFRPWVLPLLWVTMIALGGGDTLSSAHTSSWLGSLLAGLHLSHKKLL
ncbi:MAG TPA: hypothetical protein VE998_11205, partial [Terriglobales bacterium]|nr:hypothetical protein [Terriglobales bacterium]